MKEYFKSILFAVFLIILTISFISNPKEILDASIRGLNIWWTIVFPSLLPFFILSELLISFGLVSFLGVLLEPIMRILFKVPGIGGFVLAMGMSSGLPSGAKLSTSLRKENQLTRVEAERLNTFTNTSNPLFIIGAVSAGFFHNEKLGLLIASSHYLSNLVIGICMRFYGKEKINKKQISFSFSNAIKQLHIKRLSEKRKIGQILGDAITTSIHTLLTIGGFIILFSVLNKLMQVTSIFNILTIFISKVLPGIISTSFIYPFLSGIFEITLGSQLISQLESNSLLAQVAVTSSILAFGGFSVHAQVASLISSTDIRYFPYLLARLLQSIIAPIFTIILWKPLYLQLHNVQTVIKYDYSSTVFPPSNIGPIITLFSLYVYVFFLLYYHYFKKSY